MLQNLYPNQRDDLLLWLDLEMTGLDTNHDRIIEIAAVITDKDLNIIAQSESIAIQTDQQYLDNMSDYVKEMHIKNGLLDRVLTSTIDIETAEETILEFARQYIKPYTSPLCGNSIYNDRMFLRNYMSRLDQFLHYRLLDVSSIKIFVKEWCPEVPTYTKNCSHLALDDILESIKELNYYRKYLSNGSS